MSFETDIRVTEEEGDKKPVTPASLVECSLADFPVHDLGPWPENLSLQRADLYGDDER
jgi:hypothetical protein